MYFREISIDTSELIEPGFLGVLTTGNDGTRVYVVALICRLMGTKMWKLLRRFGHPNARPLTMTHFYGVHESLTRYSLDSFI